MDDVQDTTYQDVAGEAGESVAARLGSMSSEELFALADDLTALKAQPGWVKLEELVELQRASIERGAMRRLWSHFATGKALREQAPFIRLGGVMHGLGQSEQIIESVLRAAHVVRKQLGLDGEA